MINRILFQKFYFAILLAKLNEFILKILMLRKIKQNNLQFSHETLHYRCLIFKRQLLQKISLIFLTQS